MKAILLFFASILLLSFVKIEMQTGIRTPVEKYEGKIKTITETDYMAWISSPTAPNADTLRWRSTVIKNFDKGNIERDEAYVKQSGEVLNTNTPKYDDHGRTIQILSVDKHKQVFPKIIDKYDTLGNKIEETHYNEKDSVHARFIYKYDAHGNCIEWRRFNNKNATTSKHLLKYDEHNNNTEEQSFIIGDKPFEKFTYKYNEKGLEIEKKTYRGDTVVNHYVNTYDSHDNLAQSTYYDSKDHLQEELSSIHKYEYDKTGNWTKHEVLSTAGKPRFRTVRKIEYY